MAFIKNKTELTASDAELLSLFKETGNKEALANLYERYMDLLFAVCYKYLGDEEEAKDAVMQIFEELLIKLQKHSVSNFKSWLHTLARNFCLMQLRKQKRTPITGISENFVQSDENEHLEKVIIQEARLSNMEDCLEKLPLQQKQAVQLFYLQEKCYKEIAAELDMEWNKVRSYIQNGRRNLKICMESLELTEKHDK